MAPRGGPLFCLLILACAASAQSPDRMPGNKQDFKDMAKRLMKKCKTEGYQEPRMTLLKTVFNNSDFPVEDRKAGQSNTFLSAFLDVLHSVTPGKGSIGQADTMTNKMWNCSNLSTMIRLIRNSSEASACYLKAFVAPLSWATWTSLSENSMDSDDYDSLLWAAKPVVQDMPSARMNLPAKVEDQNMKKLMRMLQEVYEPMSEGRRTQVVKWAKEQIAENYFNCTMRPSSDSSSNLMERCKSSLKWLNSEALTMMGPYLSHLAPGDVDSSPKEKLCEFFRSAQFKSSLRSGTKMSPSLSKKFLQRFQQCFKEKKEFAAHVDKLGSLACYYDASPDLTPDLSRKLLPDLNNCDGVVNPGIIKLKKRLVEAVMANYTTVEALRSLGSSVTLLSPRELSTIHGYKLMEVLKGLGNNIKWSQNQLHTLVRKQLGEEKCKTVPREELMALQSVAGGFPSCVLKHIKAQEVLNDREGLNNISRRMRKGQLKAMLQGLLEDAAPSELVQKLPGTLLRRMSLNNLAKANITSLNQVVDKMWSQPQAAFLAKKMHDLNQLTFRRLRSVLQGFTCKMIDKVADGDMQDMAQTIAETPQWISKVQTGCAARKLFAALKEERADYFKTITEEEMAAIPTLFLLHLPPTEVKDLPYSVCPVLLAKMEVADLSSLPLRAPSRPALAKRSLLCLAKERDLSRLTAEDVSRLGAFLCELQPSQLYRLAPDVLNSSLLAMASCQHIPQRNRADLILLLNQTFGDPSDWSAETMEALGPLVLLDDNATSALPNKPWMKDVLYFLKPHLRSASSALNKKVFDLTTTTSNAARRKRAADNDGNGGSNSIDAQKPTVELIEELRMNNVYWTAAQLEQMSTKTFLATVETLGNVSDYSPDQLAVLSKKAVQAFGPVSQMNEGVVMQLGCITRGFPNADLETLHFLLDPLEEIAHCGWNESQMKAVWRAVAKYNDLTAPQLGATEMVDLNRFICGLNSSEIKQLNMDAFKDAVGSMDGIQCSYNVMQQLKSLAVSAFGVPSTWTEAQVSELGNIIAGLNATELSSLDPAVFAFLSESCIPLIPSDVFAALSAAQLQALGSDNAAMVTSAQRAALSDDKLAALERAVTGSRDQTQSLPPSGAPSLSVEGIAGAMKPLLFLLMGFLLL